MHFKTLYPWRNDSLYQQYSRDLNNTSTQVAQDIWKILDLPRCSDGQQYCRDLNNTSTQVAEDIWKILDLPRCSDGCLIYQHSFWRTIQAAIMLIHFIKYDDDQQLHGSQVQLDPHLQAFPPSAPKLISAPSKLLQHIQ